MDGQPDAIALDVHAHLLPVNVERLADAPGVKWNDAEGSLTIDGHQVGMKKLFRPDLLLEWMNEMNVEHAWVSAPPPAYRQHLFDEDAYSWSNYLNEQLAAVCLRSAGRLSPLMHLPTQDPGQANRIARHCARAGHNKFSMPTGTGRDLALSNDSFNDLWKTLDDAKAFVFFHPGECADGRLKAFYLGNLLGNPYESAVALAHLVFSGVLERHVNIVPCFAHAGGLTPMVVGRWDQGYATARPGVDLSLEKPSRLMNRVHVDCICHSEPATFMADRTFGPKNVVFGSDWPFPMGLMNPREQLKALGQDRLQRYLSDNPRKLMDRFNVRKEET